MLAHIVANTRFGIPAVTAADRARWLWRCLQLRLPDTVCATLMPHHVHLAMDPAAARRDRRRLGCILAAFSRRFGLGQLWQPLPQPTLIQTPDKCRRLIRYLLLNPCRPTRINERPICLVDDPLKWPWSTHRDAVGAVAQPWVRNRRLAAALEVDAAGLDQWLHRYVSSDPHVAVAGTPPPRAAPATTIPAVPLASIALAATAALRLTPDAIRRRGPARRLFVALAIHQGWTDPTVLAQACGVQAPAIRRLARFCPPDWVAAAALCLGDERLLLG